MVRLLCERSRAIIASLGEEGNLVASIGCAKLARRGKSPQNQAYAGPVRYRAPLILRVGWAGFNQGGPALKQQGAAP